ncbi:MAG: hypothetical protein HY825_12595 [Acidobacteria bacterium]|nr:hypothetical protein [Acidobacteriota bacterium]
MTRPHPFAIAAAAVLAAWLAGPAKAQTPAAPGATATVVRLAPRQGLPARTAALLLSGQTGGDVAISVAVVPVVVRPEGGRLALVVDVDAASFLGEPTTDPVRLELAVYATTPAGVIVGSLLAGAVLDPPQAGEARARGGLKLLGSLDVPPGEVEVRVLVQRAGSIAFGLAETVAAVPAGQERFLARPVIDEPAGAWLVALPEGPLGWDALALADGIFPATRPVLRPGSEIRARLVGRGLPGPEVQVRVRRNDGTEAGRVGMRRESDDRAGGLEVRRVVLVVPAVAPGDYTFEVPTGGAGDEVSVVAVPVVVAADGTVAAAWPKATAPATSVAAGVAEPAAGGASEPAPPAHLRVAYLDALSHFAPDDPGAAEAELATFERDALRERGPDAQKRLQSAELDVAGELARREPAALFALLQLHVGLARTYGAARAAQPQAHTFKLCDGLAALTVRSAGKAGRAPAADAMACLAGSSQRVGAQAAAEEQHRITLLLDPENTAALEGLAAGLERTGRYREAEKLLTQLVAKRPNSLEARLRLALTRQRMGDDNDVEALLRACVAPGGPEWIRAVAWQELARLGIDAGKLEAAATVLREATAALPRDRELAVLRAFVLDRSGRHGEARAAAVRLTSRSSDAASARFAYSELPATELDRACAALATRVSDGAAAALVRAVAAARAGGPR